MQKRFPSFLSGSVFDHMDYYRHARNRRKWGFKRGHESNGKRAEMMKNHWKRPKKVFGSCWDVEVGCSSHLTRTKIPLKSLISEGFFYSLPIAAQEMKLNIFNILLCSSCKCSIIYYNAATLGRLCIMDLENRLGD